MSNAIKILKKRFEKLIDLEPSENKIKRINIIRRKVLEELKTIRTDKIKNLEEIEMDALMLKEKRKIRKLWNNSDEFEIEKAEIKILKDKQNNIRKIIKIKIRIEKAKSYENSRGINKKIIQVDKRFRRNFKRDIN